jgi:hypothetical protein
MDDTTPATRRVTYGELGKARGISAKSAELRNRAELALTADRIARTSPARLRAELEARRT